MSSSTSELVTTAGKSKKMPKAQCQLSHIMFNLYQEISGGRWVPITDQDGKGNCQAQGLRPQEHTVRTVPGGFEPGPSCCKAAFLPLRHRGTQDIPCSTAPAQK